MIDAAAFWIGDRLLLGSVQGALVIVAVWLACRFVPRIPAAAQAMLWWVAALKLVLVFTPVPTLPLPLLPAAVARHEERLLPQPTVTAGAMASTIHEAGQPESEPSPPLTSSAANPLRTIVALWIGMLVVHLVRLMRTHHLLRGILRRSVVWMDEEVGELARRVGLTRVPPVCVSDEIETPQVVGIRTPVVLVPVATATHLTPGERSMTMCHELMHIRRRDVALGWVPACAERLFFFHPLVRLAAREYLTARESACDAAVVRALDVSPADYGRLLIRLGVDGEVPAFSAGGSPFSSSSLKRRLQMLQQTGSPDISRGWRWAIGAAALVILPMQLVAQAPTAGPSLPASPLRTSPPPVARQAQGATTPSPEVKGTIEGIDGAINGTLEGAVEGTIQGRVDNGIWTGEATLNFLQQATSSSDDVRAQLDAAAKAFEKTYTDDVQQAYAALLREVERQKSLATAADEIYRIQEQGRIGPDLKRLREKLEAARAEVARAEAEVSQGKERTAAVLAAQLRQEMLRQQETLKRQIERMAELQERLAAEQRRLAEEIERLRQSLDKR